MQSGIAASALALCLLPVQPILGGATVTASVPTDMAAEWALDEGAGTSILNSVTDVTDGQTRGGAAWVDGHDGTGHALSFDGNDGAVAIGGDPTQQSQSMSITFWARASAPAAGSILVGETGSDCQWPWLISTGETGTLELSVLTTSGAMEGGSSVPSAATWDDTWHFLAVTFSFGDSGFEYHTWVDGIRGAGGVGPDDRSLDYSTPGLSLTVGGPAAGCGTAHSFRGAVDDLRIYDRVLTSDELGSFPVQIPTSIEFVSGTTYVTCDSGVEVDARMSPTPVNGGSVDFYVDDGTGPRLVTSASSSSEGVAGFLVPCLPVGDDILTAVYRGAPPYLGSSSAAFPITVSKRSSTVWLQGQGPTPFGTSLALSIYAWPGEGTVSLYETTDGGRRLAGSMGPGQTYVNLGGLALGEHDFVAEYTGDEFTLPSTSAVLVAEIVPNTLPTAHVTVLPTATSAASFVVSWGGLAGTASIVSYDVRYRRAPWNGSFGAYGTWLAATGSTRGSFLGATGSTYCFSVRAHDSIGAVSPWSAETCTATPLDDRSLARSASWRRRTGSSTSYFAGTYVKSFTYGARLVRTGVIARRIWLLATTCRGCGAVAIYWGGNRVRTISLASPTTVHRKLIPITVFSSARVGTLTVRVVSTDRPVLVDGVVVSRN